MDKLRAAAKAVAAVNDMRDPVYGGKKEESVRVCVRCRPLNSKERGDGRERIVHVDPKNGTCVVSPIGSNEPPKTFTFDQVYDESVTQEYIYMNTASRIVESVIDGFNGTIFAYGQTGTGKTFTMEGVNDPPELRGIIPRAFQQIFDLIAARGGQNTEFLVRASYLEIYNEEIRDLLSKNTANKLELKENPDAGVYVRDLTSYVVKSTRECDKLRDFGAKNRHVGATAMNQDSSRSHSIYTITVESCETREDGSPSIRMGKLNLVDLAGSERQSKTQASGDRLKEATKINLSLSALGNCISALVDGKSSHIPYRDSRLTRLLQDSLGGNTKTVMVANLGPADWNFDETMSTLRYANRAKNIKNKPKINEDPKDAMLREFQEEIARLKAALADAGGAPMEEYIDESGQKQLRPVVDKIIENVVEVEKEVEKIVEIEKVIEVEREVEVVREIEVERFVEVEKEVERIVTVEVDREVEVIKEVEVEVGVAHEEVERIKQELLTAHESDRAALREEMRRKEEQRDALTQQLADMKTQIRKDRDTQIKLAHRLKQLEAKLLVGGQSLLDRDDQLRQEQLRIDEEIEAKRREEEELQKKLELEEEVSLGQERQYKSLQEEVEDKTAKLKKLFAKFKQAQAEILELQQEYNREKEDILDTIRKLSKQQALKQLIMTSYIPLDQLSKIERCSEWDEANEGWRISRLQYAGNKMRAKRDAKGSAEAAAPDASPMRARSLGTANKGEAPPVPDVAKAMAAVYFSYEAEPAVA